MMKVKYILFTLTMMLGGVFAAGSAGAITETREVDVQFTFNPVLTVSLSSADILISDLVPGGVKNSNEIGVTVETNNSFGYLLTATVGNTENDSRNLVHTNGTTNFASIDVSSNLTALVTDSTWGYSVDSGATFSGLPKWDDATNVAELNSSTGAVEETTNFLIGAKAAAGQLAGDYSNVINFFAVSKVDADTNPTLMQNVTSATCTTTPTVVVDARDDSRYTIQRLEDGNCWMMENLRLGSTSAIELTPENTNITANWTLPASGTANFDSTNGYTNAAINIDSRDVADANGSKYGTYYNYCAASAGTYCYASGSGTGNATTDVCPKGWRLPTGGVSGEFQALVTAYSITSNVAGSTILQQILRFPLAGYFDNGSTNNQASDGYYWSSAYYTDALMYALRFHASSVHPQNYNLRYLGFSVRCVLQ